MRKLSLVLAILMALCGCAVAETENAAIAPEDFLGLWNLEYAVAQGIQMNARDYGLTVILTVDEDGAAVLDYGDGSIVEMTWRIEGDEVLIAGYAEDDVQMSITEEGLLKIEDEVGKTCFSRPVEETAAE